MAYQIDRYNNTVLTIVEDGTINQTTDLKLVGKNYAGYGEIQNENFIFLLENFAGANPPPRAISGQVWFDSGASKLKFYDGTQWRTTGGSEIASLEPTGLSQGDFWWDTANEQLYVFNGTEFVLIGPQNAGDGVTAMVSASVLDNAGNPQSIIQATLEDEVIYIISATEFTLNASNPIAGFDRIKKGLTLVNTTLVQNGVTLRSGSNIPTHEFHGTASDSLKLGGQPASAYVLQSAPAFTGVTQFPDDGIAIGDSLDLRLYIDNDDEGNIENSISPLSIIKIKTANGTGTSTHSITFNSTGLIPASDNSFNVGSSSLRWANVYGVNFVGNASSATALVDPTTPGSPRTASVSTSNNTVPIRDGAGNLNANLFNGVATSARYADLAEKYTTAEELPVGTAVAVCGHEDHEVEPAGASHMCIGVVSENPAIMMNSEAEGQYIGLKGRVPVRVKGPVKKGQPVYAWEDGVSSTVATSALVGIALESSEEEGEKLIECVLKV